MNRDAVLAIDLGTGSAKALLATESGTVIARAAFEYPVSRLLPTWAEQDPDDWWNAVESAVRAVLERSRGATVRAIGLSGQMHGTVLLDSAGAAIRPAIIWEDGRSAEQVAWITERVGAGRLIEIAGSPVATGFQAASVLWIQEREPESWSRTRSILLPKDYLRWRLCGVLSSEPSDASSTLLFDISKRDWSDVLLGELEIDRAQLPSIAESKAVSGHLTAAAAELGLAEGIPVVGGGGDAPLAALAADVTTPDRLLLTISTGSQAIIPAATPVTDPKGRIHTWCSACGASTNLPYWYQMGATLASGRALRWLRDQVFGLEPSIGYEQMDAWAASIPAGSGGLIFLSYLLGERTPYMDPNASGVLLGLRAHHARPHLTRAVMEGATFSLYDAFHVLSSLGAKPDCAVLAGGGARGRTWVQIVADTFDLPVHPLTEPDSSAIGAAILAGSALGWFAIQDGATMFAEHQPAVEPNPEATRLYQEILPIFRATYEKHREDFALLETISARADS